MKRVLITGATGFVGRHCLLPLLQREYEVHATFSKAPLGGHERIRWHQVDLLDSRRVAALMRQVRPTHLLHFAWVVTPGVFWTSPENFSWVQASLGLLQNFAASGGQRVVIAGTCAEYDWKYGYCSERVTPLVPDTVYGVCKHSLQLMQGSFARRMEISAAWGRIFFLYGPQEHSGKLVSSVIHSLLRGEPALCSHGNQIRDFLHVQDVADAFAALLESDVRGAVNIASGAPVALKDVIMNIAEIMQRRDLVRLGARDAPANEPAFLVGDVSRLTHEVGWNPQYDLHGGLAHTVQWQMGQMKTSQPDEEIDEGQA